MGYRYATERADYTDLASGYVLRSTPGYPGFPVRLASELFQRALAHVGEGPVTLWDPCCGSGYLATVLGLLHRDRISHILASDVAPDSVELAARNLALVTSRGLDERERELRTGAVEFDKPAFHQRADAAQRLAGRLAQVGGDLPSEACWQDAFAPAPLADPVDLVLTDVPYGALTRWSGVAPNADPLSSLLVSLAAVLPNRTILAVTAKSRKIPLPAGVYPQERFRVGNRAAVLVRAGEVPR